MKVIKPQKLSVLHRVVEAAGRLDLCVTVMIASPFDAPESPLHEVNLWKMLGAELGPDTPPDPGLPKARPEVLVIGKAHPREEERTSCAVRLRLGPIDKTLQVPVETAEDRAAPVGFGPVDPTAPEHLAKAGTFDEAWQKEEAPRLPRDFDFAFYNLAPLDQQLDEPLEGGLAFALDHLHPDAPVLEGRLPRALARVFVTLEGGELREVPMRLETVQLFPEAARMLVLFRGVTAIAEDDASDVRELIAACEAPGAPRPVEHYRAVLAERLDRKRGALASLRDSDLMPEGPTWLPSPGELAGPDSLPPPEQRLRANLRRKVDGDLEAARARLRAAGLDPDEHLPAVPPRPPGGSPLDDVEGSATRASEESGRLKAGVAVKQAEAEATARKQREAAGLDPDAALAEPQGGPPTFSAAAEMEKLHALHREAESAGVRLPGVEAQLADPAHREKLEAAERGLRDLYHRRAHQLPAAPPAEARRSEQARLELSAAPGGASFAGRDFTRVDLSGLDLRGADLRGALLEGANLAGAQLAGADLTSAVLARADLTGADLTGARLAGCNLGHAVLAFATLTGDVDLTGAVLTGADLTGASFHGARLARVDFGEAFFRDTDLGAIRGEGLTFLRSDLRGTKLAGAAFVKCSFIEVDLRGVDLTGVDLRGATLVGVDARGAVLRGAQLTKLCAVSASSFEGADFTGAVLDRANLRGCKLAGCDFTRAALGGADLSGCDLRGARFDRAVGREARFVKADLTRASLVDADLMSALLGRATVRGASFLGANLFRADLSKIDADEATVMDEAHLVQARVVAARRPHGAR